MVKTKTAKQKKHCQSLGRNKKSMRVASFLNAGPLPVKDLCDLIVDYTSMLEGRRKYTHTFRLLILSNGTLAVLSKREVDIYE